MRILIFGNLASIHTRKIIKGLINYGHNVIVVSYDKGDISGVESYYFGSQFIPRQIWYLFAGFLVRLLKKRLNPDIAISIYMTGYGFAGALSGISPLITMALGSDVLLTTKSFGLKRIFCDYVARRSSKIIAVSEQIERELLSRFNEPSKIIVCPIGIDLNLFKWPENSNVRERGLIVSTRPFEPIYNVEQFLKALPIVFKENQHAGAELIGNGSLKSYLEELCCELGINDRVKFRGSVSLSELIMTLQRAEIYVSVSKSDGAPVTLFEAIACGCFPVVSDIDANRRWIKNGVNGYLVPIGDHNYLADKLRDALSKTELRKRAMIVNRKIAITNFDMAKSITMLEEYLCGICDDA